MGVKVLVVDDDPDIVLTVQLMLEQQGYEVDSAANGSEAVFMAGEMQPHVVVLDYRMPGMNGDQTAKMLKSLSPDLRIIGFSAYSDIDTEWGDIFIHKKDMSALIPAVEKLTSGI